MERVRQARMLFADADALASRFPVLRRPLLFTRSPQFPLFARAGARFLIVLYFVNFAATWLQYASYGYYGDWKLGPFWAVLSLLASVAALVTSVAAAVSSSTSLSGWKARVSPASAFRLHAFVALFLLAAREMASVFWHQLWSMFEHGHGVFINELLTKKLAICASAALLVAEDPQFRARIQGSAAFRRFGGGIVLSDSDFDETNSPGVRRPGALGVNGQQEQQHSAKRSIFLLAARLMIGLLFLYVGYYEVTLQLQRWTGYIAHNGHSHMAAAEDGHNQMWAKLMQFAMALPLVVGYRTRHVCVWISAVCILESFVQWRFWATPFGIGYGIHARDHFVVNLAVAGGLWLLASLGAGKYSVDALLKKKE